jgi:hypothetical protein
MSTELEKQNAQVREIQALQAGGLAGQVANITAQLNNERRRRIETDINNLVTNCQLTAGEAPQAIARAVADETYLAELQARPQVLPGAAPLNFACAGIHTQADSVRNALGEIVRSVGKPGQDSLYNAAERSHRVANVYAEARGRILQVMNAAANNTIDAGLKRVLILQEVVRDFATRVLPLRLFCSVFNNVPLQGTDTVVVRWNSSRRDTPHEMAGHQFGHTDG